MSPPTLHDGVGAVVVPGDVTSTDTAADRAPVHRPWSVATFALGFLAGTCLALVAACVAGGSYSGAAPLFRGLHVALTGAGSNVERSAFPSVDAASTSYIWTEAHLTDDSSPSIRYQEAARTGPSTALDAGHEDASGLELSSPERSSVARRSLEAGVRPLRPRERMTSELQAAILFGRVEQLERELARLTAMEASLASSSGSRPHKGAIQHVRRMLENTAGPAHEAAISRLVAEIRQHAPKEHVDRCVSMVEGGEGSLDDGFSGQGQDWAVFHNFFAHMPWGQGFYLDLGAGDPMAWSNTAFFDWCLGWKGICVEPNPKYHSFYKEGSPKRMRSCALVKNCISNQAKSMWVDFADDARASFKSKPGNDSQLTEVACQTLDAVLEKEGVWPSDVDFVSLDMKGAVLPSLFCFPFQKWKIPIWLVDLVGAPIEVQQHFLRNGYAQVLNILGQRGRKCPIGSLMDTVFALMDPPLALGPMFLPGRPLQGSHPRGVCRPEATGLGCPQQLPVLITDEFTNKTGRGGVFRLGECGDVLLGSASKPHNEKPAFDLPTSENPRSC